MDKAQAVGERCGQGAERDIECMAWALPQLSSTASASRCFLPWLASRGFLGL